MIISNIENFSSMSMVRAKVELYDGFTLVKTCTCSDVLEQFKITRECDNSKFFGFGICQKLNINLIDLDRELNITTDYTTMVTLGDGEVFDSPYPTFYITEVDRDEKTNSISCTAYDDLYKAASHTFSELELSAPYNIRQVAFKCAQLLGVPYIIDAEADAAFNSSYDAGANFDGSESIRTVLNQIAEVTQTIYYIDFGGRLVFKRLKRDTDAVLTISKNDYYEMKTQIPKKLTSIAKVTELGDNVEVNTGEEGITQYIRNNPFWESREDISTLLDNALAAVGNLTINQFTCDWSGNWLLEIGDKIAITTENNELIYSYVLSDTLSYDGTLNEITEWIYTENDNETFSNPNNLGEKLNETYARVDKVNKQIILLAAETESTNDKVSSLEVTTEGISSSVSSLSTITGELTQTLNDNFETLSESIKTKVSATDVQITVEKELSKGVDKVQTSTGFTFNDEGLTVSKSGTEMSTRITEDGMTVYKDNEVMLIADNLGVDAVNLKASTYLIIGTNSRFENYGDDRTACFWIGG